MKAWVLHGIGDIRLEEIEAPILAEDEVLLKVKAAGICGSDIPRIYRTGAHVHPLIPGHEFSGVVERAGGESGRNWLGKRVGVFPLLPCKSCGPCKEEKYEMCRNYGYLGSRRDGGFAEYAAVPAANLIALPESVSFEAAAMLEPMAVAVHAMRRVMPKPGDRVVVWGLGTIGLLLTAFLLDAGITSVLAIGNKVFQRRQISKLGLSDDAFCDSRGQDVGQWLSERTEGAGADVFFECVGKNETVSQVVDHTAPGGKICLVGNPGSNMELEKNVYWKILRNQLTVTGTWNSSFTHCPDDDWNYVLDRLGRGSVAPEELITHKFPLEELRRGFHIMRDKQEDYVKIMGTNYYKNQHCFE